MHKVYVQDAAARELLGGWSKAIARPWGEPIFWGFDELGIYLEFPHVAFAEKAKKLIGQSN